MKNYRIAFTSLFTPNPDKLSLFCLADLPGVLRYDYEEEEYQEELKRALQEAIPFEMQDEIKNILVRIVFEKGDERWQPREGDNWEVPEGMQFKIMMIGDLVRRRTAIIRLKAAEPDPFKDITPEMAERLTKHIKFEPSGDDESQEMDQPQHLVVEMLKTVLKMKSEGNEILSPKTRQYILDSFHLTRKP